MSPLLFGVIAGATVFLLIACYFAFKKYSASMPLESQPILFISPPMLQSRPPSDKLPVAKTRDCGIQSLAREMNATNKGRENRANPKNNSVLERSQTTPAEPKIHPLLSDSREFPPDAVFAAAQQTLAGPTQAPVMPIQGVPTVDPIAQALEVPAPAAIVTPDDIASAVASPQGMDLAVAEASLFFNSNGIIDNYEAIGAPLSSLATFPEPSPQILKVMANPAAGSTELLEGFSPPSDEEFVQIIESVVVHERVPSEPTVIEFPIPAHTEADCPSDLKNELAVPYGEQKSREQSSELFSDATHPAADDRKRTAPAGFLTFYGLGQQPFDVTPDPGYLYLSRVHREALTSLSQGIENFRGFMALVAEPGLGKTTVLNKLMEEFRDSSRIVFLFQTQCTSSELLRYLLSELGVDYAGSDVVGMHKKLNDVLFQEMLQGRRFLLIVDEAQNLDDSVLETIRLLSNFETTHSKLIQIILAGQPELLDTLVRPCLSQLRQRTSILTHLEPLGVSETAEYIRHRLRSAGFDGAFMFTPEALESVAERSGGVPRCINNICFNALLSGYTLRREMIDNEIVEKVASDLDMALLVKRTQREMPESSPGSLETANGNGSSGDVSATNGSSENGSSRLARLLIEALARDGSHAVSETKPKTDKGFALTGKLTEKLTSQSWGKKNEFRIQVSLEREYSPSLPIADHYYCRSFYVSEDQAVHLREGKQVRLKFEQD